MLGNNFFFSLSLKYYFLVSRHQDDQFSFKKKFDIFKDGKENIMPLDRKIHQLFINEVENSNEMCVPRKKRVDF